MNFIRSKKIVSTIVIALLLIYILGSGIWDLANTDARCTVEIESATSLMEIEHSLAGIIPLGKDYYYIGIEKNTNNAYVISASKNWLEKTFTPGQSATIKGLTDKYQDFDEREEIKSALDSVNTFSFPLGTDRFINISYVKESCIKIISTFIIVICYCLIAFLNKREQKIQWLTTALTLILYVGLFVMLLTII